MADEYEHIHTPESIKLTEGLLTKLHELERENEQLRGINASLEHRIDVLEEELEREP